MSDYRYTVDVEVRYRDIDNMGHVNNVVYATYLEQARGQYYRDVLDLVLTEVPTVIVHLELDFESSIGPHDDVTVAMRVPRLGTSSIPMEYEVRADDRVAATGETVQVVTDPETGRAAEVPEDWRHRITEFEGFES